LTNYFSPSAVPPKKNARKPDPTSKPGACSSSDPVVDSNINATLRPRRLTRAQQEEKRDMELALERSLQPSINDKDEDEEEEEEEDEEEEKAYQERKEAMRVKNLRNKEAAIDISSNEDSSDDDVPLAQLTTWKANRARVNAEQEEEVSTDDEEEELSGWCVVCVCHVLPCVCERVCVPYVVVL